MCVYVCVCACVRVCGMWCVVCVCVCVYVQALSEQRTFIGFESRALTHVPSPILEKGKTVVRCVCVRVCVYIYVRVRVRVHSPVPLLILFLIRLSLAYNAITALSATQIQALSSLEELNLDHNELTSLPAGT